MLVNVWWKWTQVYLAMICVIQISRSSINLNYWYPSEYVKDFRFLQPYCSYTLQTMKKRKGPERRKIAGQLLIDKFQKFMCFPSNKNGTCLIFQHLDHWFLEAPPDRTSELTLDSSLPLEDSRHFDHSSKLLRWRAFILIQGRRSRMIFSAIFQSSATPSATKSAHITETLLPWPTP